MRCLRPTFKPSLGGNVRPHSSLPSLVSEIRDAIADHDRKPRLIRTVQRFGYAFQAEPRAGEGECRLSGPNACWLIGTTAEVALLPGENVIGREGPGVILVKSSTVSRRHARILIEGRGATVQDLGSKNGTYVNDRSVEQPRIVMTAIRFGSARCSSRSDSHRRLSRPKRNRPTVARHHAPDF